MLSDEEVDLYSRQVVLMDIGLEGQEKLKGARVAILGMGGLGTPAALLLARMGIGYLRLVDRDTVSKTDLHRQMLYHPEDVGLPKVVVAKRELLKMNPNLEVEAVAAPLMKSNALELLDEVDAVIDGLDNIRARYILNRTILRLRLPYVFAAAVEMFGAVSSIIPGETACLECFYSGLRDEFLPKCAQVGVHPSLTFITAAISVSEVVKIMTGREPSLKGKLLFVDLRNLEFDSLEVRRGPSCSACSRDSTELESVEDLPELEASCSRDGRNVYFINNSSKLNLEFIAEIVSRKGWKIIGRGDQYLKFSSGDLSCTALEGGSIVVEVGKIDFSTENRIREIREILLS